MDLVVARTPRDLRAVDLRHVEDVGDPGPLGVDLRQGDRQAELVKRVREREEQAGPVLGEDLDDRVAGRGPIVEEDLRRDRGARPLAPGRRRPRAHAQELFRVDAQRAHVIEVASQARQDRLDSLGPPVAIAHPEDVDRLAPAADRARVDLRGEHFEPARRDRRRDAREEAGPVVGHDAQLGRLRMTRGHPTDVRGGRAPLGDDPRVLHDRLRAVRQEIAIGHRRQQRLEGLRRPVPRGPHGVADTRDALGIRPRLLPREVRFGGEVELVEHARLPRRHRRGRRRREVGHREEVQVAQPFAAANAAAKLLDRRHVVEVAASGHVVHEQVLHDELLRLLDVLAAQAEARQDLRAEVGARLRVVLARAVGVRPALAHVVEERRQKERTRARDLRGEARGERELGRELAARELPEAIERGHRVHVDRVHVVDVVVHAAGDGEKLRHHREQQAHVVELADHRAAAGPGLGDRADELDEELARLRVRAQPRGPRRVRRHARDRVARERQDRRLLPHAGGEDSQREGRVVRQLLRRGHRDVTVEQTDALAEVDRGNGLRAATHGPQPLEQARPRAGHGARVEVVVLHEALGGERAVGPVPHRDGERLLLLEPEPVGLAPRPRVEPIADAPEELLRAGELLRLAPHEHPQPDELAPGAELRVRIAVGDAVARPCAPACPVEIAKAARAALDVGLEQIDRTAEALVTRCGLRVEPIDEATEGLLAEEALVRARDEVAQRRGVSGEEAQVEERGRRREVRLSERHRVGHAQHLMADRERRVPERIEQRLGERGRVARIEPRRVDDDGDVRVAAQRYRASTEAAHGRERQPAALGRREPCQTGRLREPHLEARPEKARVRAAEGEPILTRGEPLAQDGAVPLDRVAQDAGLR